MMSICKDKLIYALIYENIHSNKLSDEDLFIAVKGIKDDSISIMMIAYFNTDPPPSPKFNINLYRDKILIHENIVLTVIDNPIHRTFQAIQEFQTSDARAEYHIYYIEDPESGARSNNMVLNYKIL